MDINRLFKAGQTACGRVMQVLPEKEIGSPKQYMMKVLKEATMPSLNELYPKLQRVVLNTSMLIKLPDSTNNLYVGYRIPLELTNGLEIMSVRSVHSGYGGMGTNANGNATGYMNGSSWLSPGPNKYGRYSSANLYETVLNAQIAYADKLLSGSIDESPIARFEPPNIIWINSSYGNAGSLYAVLCLKNDENLLAIPDKVYEGVKRLFILDLKSTIYSEYGILSNIETAVGTIDLKIDDWASAAEQRDSLYDEYRGMAHLRTHSIISG